MLRSFASLTLAIFLLPLPAPAQCADWDDGFALTVGFGVPNRISALAVHDEGQGPALYAAWPEPDASSTNSRVARLDATGWVPLGVGPGGLVAELVSFDRGDGPALYAASGTGGTARVWRWDGVGWSSIGLATEGGPQPWATLHALAVFDDGSGPALYAAGKFHGIGGQNAGGIARWNGASWSALGSGVYGGVVYTLAAFDDGSGPKLYAGGSFTNAGSLAVNGIARWHPSSGWTTPGSTTFADLVHSMTVHDDGSGAQLYASGLFDPSGSFPGGELARWNGSSWSAVGTGAPTGVRAFATFDDGSGPALYAGGSINVGGTYPGIARWDGSVWSTLGSGLFLAPMHSPTGGALAVVPDPVDGVPDLYVGGDFVLAGGQTSHNIARWNGCPTGDAFCAGDGSLAQACPCANTGVAGRGCENSAATGGARLAASGSPFADNVVLTSSGELPSALSIFLQGNVDLSASSGAVVFGDGVRCVGGALKRLYADNAENGAVSAPGAGELSIQQKSAALGDPIAPGSTRWYQVYYRDPNVAFCPAPAGNTWNVSSGVRVTW